MSVAPKRVRPEITEAVERAAELALELKATDVVALDLASIWGATDYFLLASGRSDVQVKAIAENIVDELKKKGVRPEHIEGLHFVVHVFHTEARQFYQLEVLWGDAPRLDFDG